METKKKKYAAPRMDIYKLEYTNLLTGSNCETEQLEETKYDW